MPEDTVDTVVSTRSAGTSKSLARPVVHESVDTSTGDTRVVRGSQIESGDHVDAGRRPLKESTQKLLDRLAPHEAGDADDDGAPAGEEVEDVVEAAADEQGDEAASDDTVESAQEAPAGADVVAEWSAKYDTLEQANKRLVGELEAARRTPPRQRSSHEQELLEAYTSYVDEGSTPALRKFIGAVIGAKPDSKEVDAELTGLYADLTERELNVPLDQSQKALREASRARLALARDKRERVAESEKQAPANSDEGQQIEQAGRFIESRLTVKGQSGTSLADEYPLLVAMAADFDGMSAPELLARAVRRDLQTGALNGTEDADVMIRHAASKIEAHYKAVQGRLTTATKPKTDTTNQGQAAANPASKEQRQKPGARTITNATASVAPSTPPKKKADAKKEEPRKFKSDAERRDYLLKKHFPS